ncbi:10988_t:CDS:2, partial [Entrophospora sp. SA101]
IGYGGGETNDYSSDSDKYSDNISECESENCSDYGSDYESDIETTIIKSPATHPPNIEKPMSNSTNSTDQVSSIYLGSAKTAFTKRQEKFDDKFTSKDLLNKIREIASSPVRDMLDKKGSLEDIHLWDYLLHNREAKGGISLLDAYTREELIDKLVIQVEQDSLKKYANLVLQKYSDYLGSWDIEEKNSQNFVYFSRKAYLECPKCKRLHDKDQRWFGRAYGNGSFIVKCFQQNRDESGEIFNDPSIAKKIQQKNKNIPPPVILKVKGPKFPWPFLEMPAWAKCDSPLTATEVYEEQYVKPLPEEGDVYVGSPWETGKTYTLEHLAIPEAINLLALSTRHTYSSAVTVRLNLKSYCDIDTKEINLPEHQRVVCQIESLHRIINKCKCEKKCKCLPILYDLWLDEVVSVNSQAHTRLAGRSREHLYKLIHDARRIIVMDNDLTDLNIEWIKSLRRNKLFSVIHNTYQPQKGKTFRLAPNKETVLAELWEWARVMSSLPYEERKSASLICHLRGDVQGITRALIREFPTLRIKRYHGKSDPIEKSQDFSNVEEAWKDVDLVAYTSTLKIGVSCTNPKFERAFCFFKSYIETNAGTNQMLFRMRCIKEYTCHIEQRASNLPITEEGLFHWLLKAKRESLPQELQNRGIFPDVESIIRNKDIPTVRLWVAHTLEKFRSRHLFGWRMVDFLKKAGMVVSIIKATPKAKDDTVTLTEIVKGYSSAIKAEEISDIANTNILNHEMAEHLENKPRKTLEEILLWSCHIEQRASNLPITEEGLFHWLLKAKRESLPQELQNRGIFPDVESIIRNKDIPTVRLWVAHTLEKFRSRHLFGWRMVDFLKKAGMVVSIIKATPKAKDDTVTLTEIVKGYSSAIKAEEISDIANTNILNHEMAEHLENKPRKTLEEMYALNRYHIADCYGVSPESLTKGFITEYGKYDHMKWFRNLRKLRDAGTNNETAVEAIIREDYRNDRLTTATQSEKHRICLEILKICTPVKDIDDRNKYKTDIVETRLESPESIKYLQELVPKMARVFDNTDASRSAKKSGLKSLKSKLGLLNSVISTTYGLKFKATDRHLRYYCLVGSFDSEDAPELPAYQTSEGPFYENGEDMRYGYSKLSPDEIETSPKSIKK